MTVEELKAEAKAMGYTLIKKQPPMEKFLPCTCGRNSRSRWWGVHKDDAVIVECRGCGRRVCAKNERELRQKWNAVMRGREECKEM